MDFGILPPEVNSARIYAGPGSGPMLAAAAAWDALTWQLDSFATGYSSVLSELLGQAWSGGSATAMAAAAGPYVAWATATATATAQIANQARAAAAAYEAAFAATVPPAVVSANRVQLATLVATNFFGQNTPMIAATELAYAEMWAQDAAAMYGYAAAAAAATAPVPFSDPPKTTSDAADAGQVVAAAKVALSAADQPDPFAAAVSAALGNVDGFNTVARPMIFTADAIRTAGQMGNYVLALIPQAAKAPAAAATAAELGSGTAGTRGVVLAGVGRATPVGGLSVPPNWPAAPVNSVVPSAQPAGAHPVAPLQRWSQPASRAGAHLLPAGAAPLSGMARRRRGYPVMRMRDRRFRMPRPAVGG